MTEQEKYKVYSVENDGAIPTYWCVVQEENGRNIHVADFDKQSDARIFVNAEMMRDAIRYAALSIEEADLENAIPSAYQRLVDILLDVEGGDS